MVPYTFCSICPNDRILQVSWTVWRFMSVKVTLDVVLLMTVTCSLGTAAWFVFHTMKLEFT